MSEQKQDLAGRVVIVTGSNTGIGKVTAEQLAARGAKIWLACRSEDKTMPVVESIRQSGGKADFLPLDLGDLASVRRSAEQFLRTDESLHILINNAGLAGSRGITKDGFELAFGTNHLGHFLFTMLLLPRLRASTPARIVNVSSKSHYDAKGIDWDALRKPTASVAGLPEYSVSKLCNVLFTKELARGQAGQGVTSYSLHPGVVASDIWRQIPAPFRFLAKMFMITNEEGAKTTLYCATSPDVATHDGRYYDKEKERRPARLADDEALAKELWERSKKWADLP